MGLIACVRSAMDGQGTPLDKSLFTRLVIARVRSLVCVYAIMSLKIRLAIEALQNPDHVSDCFQIPADPDDNGWIQLPWGTPHAIGIGKVGLEEMQCQACPLETTS